MTRRNDPPRPTAIRCAIYTRKSTEDGLEQEFNSLDAQRESAEAFIKSQTHEGWECLTARYDDGGFTGGNMDRPALKRLMADIESGRIDCVVVYKVDRLSRSLLDFARMMETFERRHVSFVSVTQQFNTASSMGRLVLNVLLSFAQFEREMISERTRDKIAATRRKGKWSGGMPLLGYDVVSTKLVVNETEADQVREIFRLYLELRSLLATAEELRRRGWITKSWTTKKGTTRGGHPFTKNGLYHLLTNVTYLGQVRYKQEVHPGEHAAIVDQQTFDRVQATLGQNGRTGGVAVRNRYGALLKGLLHCGSCRCSMAHSYTSKGLRRYRYYVCTRAQQRGWRHCPSPSVPAGEIERFVVDQIKAIGRDPALVAATLAETRRQAEATTERLLRERAALDRQRRADEAELRQLAAEPRRNLAQLADVQSQIGTVERRLGEIEHELALLGARDTTGQDAVAALAEFDAVWSALKPMEQSRLLALLIERIDYDGVANNISIKFRSTGIGVPSITPEESAA